jgi:hypothetical protein
MTEKDAKDLITLYKLIWTRTPLIGVGCTCVWATFPVPLFHAELFLRAAHPLCMCALISKRSATRMQGCFCVFFLQWTPKMHYPNEYYQQGTWWARGRGLWMLVQWSWVWGPNGPSKLEST